MNLRNAFWRLAPCAVAIIFVLGSIYSGESTLALLAASMMASSVGVREPAIAHARRGAAHLRLCALRIYSWAYRTYV